MDKNARRIINGIDQETFIDFCAELMHQVFGVVALPSKASLAMTANIRDEEIIIAAVRYHGDLTGSVILWLDTAGLDKAVEAAVNKYQLKVPIQYPAIFAELMNIYTAHLSARLGKDGLHLEIAPPDGIGQPAQSVKEGDEVYTLRMPTEDGATFVVFHTIGCEEDRVCSH